MRAGHFGTRLLPVGTVYDPFIARGLDALNYGCYSDARFLLVGTPSGLTLGPEGGAHQSVNTPLIGMGQPGLASFEPAFADEVGADDGLGFRLDATPRRISVYLRLSTRMITQEQRADTTWQADAIARRLLAAPAGPRRHRRDRLHRRRRARSAGRLGPRLPKTSPASACSTSPRPICSIAAGPRAWPPAGPTPPRSHRHVETLLAALAKDAGLITVLDGSPAACHGSAVSTAIASPARHRPFRPDWRPLDLYSTYRLDAEAIIDAAAELYI